MIGFVESLDRAKCNPPGAADTAHGGQKILALDRQPIQAAEEVWQRRGTLIAGPDVLTVIVRPYPARADAVVPPTAMPEMGAVSAPDEYAAVKPPSDVYTRSMPDHDTCAWLMRRREVANRHMSAADVSTTAADVSTATEMSTTSAVTTAAAMSTAAAVSRGSLGGKR
jgi:hypothetical protein